MPGNYENPERGQHTEWSAQLVNDNMLKIYEFMRDPVYKSLDFDLVPPQLRLTNGQITDPEAVARVAYRTLLGLRGHFDAQDIVTWRREAPHHTEITYWQLVNDGQTFYVVEYDETGEKWAYVTSIARKAHITRSCPVDYSRILQNELVEGIRLRPTENDHYGDMLPNHGDNIIPFRRQQE